MRWWRQECLGRRRTCVHRSAGGLCRAERESESIARRFDRGNRARARTGGLAALGQRQQALNTSGTTSVPCGLLQTLEREPVSGHRVGRVCAFISGQEAVEHGVLGHEAEVDRPTAGGMATPSDQMFCKLRLEWATPFPDARGTGLGANRSPWIRIEPSISIPAGRAARERSDCTRGIT